MACSSCGTTCTYVAPKGPACELIPKYDESCSSCGAKPTYDKDVCVYICRDSANGPVQDIYVSLVDDNTDHPLDGVLKETPTWERLSLCNALRPKTDANNYVDGITITNGGLVTLSRNGALSDLSAQIQFPATPTDTKLVGVAIVGNNYVYTMSDGSTLTAPLPTAAADVKLVNVTRDDTNNLYTYHMSDGSEFTVPYPEDDRPSAFVRVGSTINKKASGIKNFEGYTGATQLHHGFTINASNELVVPEDGEYAYYWRPTASVANGVSAAVHAFDARLLLNGVQETTIHFQSNSAEVFSLDEFLPEPLTADPQAIMDRSRLRIFQQPLSAGDKIGVNDDGSDTMLWLDAYTLTIWKVSDPS